MLTTSHFDNRPRHRKPTTIHKRAGSAAAALVLAGTAAGPATATAAPAEAHQAHPSPAGAGAQLMPLQAKSTISNLSGQLSSALEFDAARAAEDLLNRTPSTVKPAEGSYTSPFAMRWGSMHNGIDIANAIGTPILAAQSGTVIDAGPASGFGNWVRVKHSDGTITVYGHMSTIDVTVGQPVHAGQKIAGMGSEGFSTGSHVHFEVYPSEGSAVDPVPWLRERGVEV